MSLSEQVVGRSQRPESRPEPPWAVLNYTTRTAATELFAASSELRHSMSLMVAGAPFSLPWEESLEKVNLLGQKLVAAMRVERGEEIA